MVRDIKSSSSKWINDKHFVVGIFEWQKGFGAFTLGQSQIPKIVDYIKNQEQHHAKRSFKEEYVSFLKAYHVDFKTEYIFTDE